MASPGLSLVGFLPQHQGVQYLGNECVPASPSPAALAAEWAAARARLGPPPGNAGNPSIRDIPPSHAAHAAQLAASPDWQPLFAANPTWQIKLVEVAPLLAFQFSILDGKSAAHCGSFGAPPTLDELLNACLPLIPIQENFHIVQQDQGVLIRSKSLNLRPLQVGPLSPIDFGVRVGVALPFVHVVRYNGRCYLHNGYHRAYGAAAAGAPEIPCVFRDVATADEASILGWPWTFDLALLESAAPPTIHHLAAGQAHPVSLIEKTRIIQISWLDWIAPEY
jgi:hypothetical protein